jgi:hypothetical protein
MKTILLMMVFVLLLVGCKNSGTKDKLTGKSSEDRALGIRLKGVANASEQAQWFSTCVNELRRNRTDEIRWFNNIGSNDVIFITEVDPVEEIYNKCISVMPLTADKSSIYKKWLEDRISEIQNITPGMTRGQVNQILLQEGGISTPSAASYTTIESPLLKVRIEFEAQKDENGRLKFNENDKVKAVLMPYLGLFVAD